MLPLEKYVKQETSVKQVKSRAELKENYKVYIPKDKALLLL
jgi:hypothetical protein